MIFIEYRLFLFSEIENMKKYYNNKKYFLCYYNMKI